MARQANGTYIQPANTAAVSGQTISSTAFNTLITDVGTEITNSLDRQGRSAMQAALPMGNNKITGMADPTVSTDGATKNYVDNSTFSTGDVKLTIKTVADSGWILLTSSVFGNGTVGNTGSGSNIRANADCLNLFTLLFNNYSDANAPILTSGGGATTRAGQTNAATAWAANCRIQIGFFAGRALGIAGNPADLPTNRNLGDHPGTETTTLTSSNIPTLTSTNAAQAITVYPGGDNTKMVPQAPTSVGTISWIQVPNAGSGVIFAPFIGSGSWTNITSFSANNSISTTYTNGSPTGASVMQPTSFINAMIKL